MAPRATWHWWAALAAASFVTNLVWENAHGGLYDHVIPGTRFLRAALGDVVLVGTGVALSWSARRGGDRVQLAVALMLLATLAVGVELAALSVGRWGYAERMPAFAGLGLSPLLQLPVTGLVSWSLASWWCRQVGDPERVGRDRSG